MDYLYRANDGTIFEDEDECLEYEEDCIAADFVEYDDRIILLRDDGKPIKFTDIISKKDRWRFVERFYCKDAEAKRVFINFFIEISEDFEVPDLFMMDALKDNEQVIWTDVFNPDYEWVSKSEAKKRIDNLFV